MSRPVTYLAHGFVYEIVKRIDVNAVETFHVYRYLSRDPVGAFRTIGETLDAANADALTQWQKARQLRGKPDTDPGEP